MEKARSNTMSLNLTISSITKVIGKTVCPTDLAKPTTIMAKSTKDILLTAKEKVMDLMSLTKSIDTKASGKITISQEKENFSEMANFSSKANSNLDLNMALANINMKTVTTLRGITSKMKKEEKESTIFTKAVSCNRNSILDLHRFLKSN